MEPETETVSDMSLREKMRQHSGKGARAKKVVPVPLIGDVTIQNLTAREQIEVAENVPDGCDNLVVVAHYIIACALDEFDRPLWTEDDVEEVVGLDPRIYGTLAKEVRDLCGLDISTRTAAKN